jgi:hypothetical protein
LYLFFLMSSQRKISEYVLTIMNRFLDNEKIIGQAGKSEDLQFIVDGSWLKDAAVIDTINNRKGGWEVDLIFAHYQKPLQLITRNITRCFSEQKALSVAFYMRKEAAKDRRGTLHVSIDDLDLCKN